MDVSQYLEIFLDETTEHLQNLNTQILILEQEPETCEEGHKLHLETVDNEYHVTMDHPMTKGHYISFIAYVTSDGAEIVKLYPEQDISVRFRKKGHGILYAYCNRHGMVKALI